MAMEHRSDYVYSRLTDFRLTMNLIKYAKFLNEWGIMPLCEGETFNNLMRNKNFERMKELTSMDYYIYYFTRSLKS